MSVQPHSAHAPTLLDHAGRAVHADPWCFLEDEQSVEDKQNVVLGLERLEAFGAQLIGRNGRLGALISPDQAVERLAPMLDRLSLIAIAFPSFKDGRGLSGARVLRARYGYGGEIRAVGEVLIDQVGFMLRCGFTAFALRHPEPEAAFAAATGRFSLHYQSASERRAAIAGLRLRKASPHDN